MSRSGKIFSRFGDKLPIRIWGKPEDRVAFLDKDVEKASKFDMIFDKKHTRNKA